MGRLPKHNRRTSSSAFQKFYVQPEIKWRALALLNNVLKAGSLRLVHTGSGDPSTYLPRMDMMHDQNSGRTVAVFELPGVRNDELTLSVHDGVMYLNGKRSVRTPEEYGVRPTLSDDSKELASDKNGLPEYKTQELRYGLFKREIQLPEGIKEQDVTACLKDGLLIVTWPLPGSSTNAAKGTEPRNETGSALQM